VTNRISARQLAGGLLAFCFLALIIGLINTVQLSKQPANQNTQVEDDDSTGVSDLLGKPSRLSLISLSGVISMDSAREGGGLFKSDSNAISVRKALDAAAKDNSVKGVLLRINSPGGTVAMSQELNEAVTRVSRKKPIVVSMGDLAASGGYYTACAADKIVANPGTLTASIGVIISSFDFSDLMNRKLGVQAVTIKTGRFKDILSPYRKPTEEDKALLQALIQDSYQEFIRAIVSGRTRHIKEATVRDALVKRIKAIADGRIVTGLQAKTIGLVDEIGDQDRAYTILDGMARERFHIKKAEKRLPLKTADEGFNMADVLGLHSKAPDLLPTEMLPVSARYPNQPLWVME
jgi:protease IV